jgi:hypothetical protein
MATAAIAADDGAQDDGVVTPPANDAGEAAQLSEVEQLAQEMGWKPAKEYTGAPERWKPAKDYVLAEREFARTMKSTIRNLNDKIERLAETSSKQTERALRRQAEEINGRFTDAVKAGDAKTAAEAAKEMRELERETQAPSKGADADFARDNPWYGKDEDATAYAVAISQREAAKGASVQAQLEAASAGVRKRFPELFEDRPAPKPQPGVNAPSSRAVGRPAAKTFADLPAEAKQAAQRYADLYKQRFGAKVEDSLADYAKDYFANANA